MNIDMLKRQILERQERQKNCNHEYDEDRPYCITVGRFGGTSIPVKRCKKCGFEFYNNKEYNRASKEYDDRGMPIEQGRNVYEKNK